MVKPKTLRKVTVRTGMIYDMSRDVERRAMLAGKRRSRTGNIYWETRRNRSDGSGMRY